MIAKWVQNSNYCFSAPHRATRLSFAGFHLLHRLIQLHREQLDLSILNDFYNTSICHVKLASALRRQRRLNRNEWWNNGHVQHQKMKFYNFLFVIVCLSLLSAKLLTIEEVSRNFCTILYGRIWRHYVNMSKRLVGGPTASRCPL